MRFASLAFLIACAFAGCSSDNCHRCPNCDGSGQLPSSGVLRTGATAPK